MLDSLDVIKKQIKLGEDSIFEFKSVRFNGNQIVGPNRKSIADEIASMANTNNGIILLGIDDSTHKVTGIPNEKLDVTETWIRDICYDSIKPPINCIIRKLSIPDEQNIEKSVIRIDVP